MTTPRPICIVGAGVLGLTTAFLLQEKDPRTKITIVSAEFPVAPPFSEAPRPSPDYASMWAGALYLPMFGSPQLGDEHLMAVRTAKHMKRIARHNPEAGVQEMRGREVFDFIPKEKAAFRAGDNYAGENDEFRILGQKELPSDAQWGCEYNTWTVNVHVYCRWLLTNFIQRGGNIIQQKLNNLSEAFEILPGLALPLVINCSGRNFDTDPRTNIMRGQTVLVKNQFHKAFWRRNEDGTGCIIIPRPLGGGTIIGGVKQLGDYEAAARPEETRKMLSAAVKYCPEFVSSVDNFEVVTENVGRRPFREGGMRIERESLGRGREVIHGYGAGQRGFELSWGAAERIRDLVQATTVSKARL